MGFLRFIASAGVSALLVGATVVAVVAQDNECVRLEARLASLDGDDGFGSDSFEKYEAAVARQRMELERATGQARAAGCIGGFTIFQNRRNPRCGQIMSSITRLRGTLSRLSAARDRAGGFGLGAERERSEILHALALNQCGPQYASFGRRSFFRTLFGPQRGGWGDDNEFMPGGDHFGTYRTLCVRTCDGYYFPISFATVQSKFGEDEGACRNLCPGTDVALYIHRSPGEESEAMTSLAGEPYASLPNAFKYRKAYDKACTCGTPIAVARALEAPPEPGATPIDPSRLPRPAPVPAARPGPGEDPETLANRAGGFMPKAVEFHDTPPARTTDLSASGKPVRVVGPTTIVAQ